VRCGSRPRLGLEIGFSRGFALPYVIPDLPKKLVDHHPAYAQAYKNYLEELKGVIRSGNMRENDLVDEDWSAIYNEKQKQWKHNENPMKTQWKPNENPMKKNSIIYV
jgi:hypothetical protein